MTQDPIALASAFASIPEIRVLQTCARRAGVRAGLRGGVVRNLLLTFDPGNDGEPSLYDFIDPFSDLDLVVEDPLDWPPLWEAIQSSLPFAGFHRWEAQPLARIQGAAERFGNIPIDRFLVWFDGRAAEPGPSLDAVDMSPGENWRRHLAGDDRNLVSPEWIRRPDRAAILLAALKALRYFFQYPESVRPITREMLDRQLQLTADAWKRVKGDPLQEAPPPELARLLELAVLDLLFTTRDWDSSLEELRTLRSFMPDELLKPGNLLNEVFDQENIQRAARIGASAYRPAPRANLWLRIHFEADADPALPSRTESGLTRITPWTPVSVYDPAPPADCCRHRDFRHGAAVIAWRDRGGGGAGSRREDPSELALAARFGGRDAIRTDIADEFAHAFSFPGFVSTGQAVTARFDHGYVRTIARRDVTFHAAVVRSEIS